MASENGRRTAGVVTYQDTNVADAVAKLRYVTEHDLEVKRGLPPETRANNIAKMAEGCCRIIEQWSEEPVGDSFEQKAEFS